MKDLIDIHANTISQFLNPINSAELSRIENTQTLLNEQNNSTIRTSNLQPNDHLKGTGKLNGPVLPSPKDAPSSNAAEAAIAFILLITYLESMQSKSSQEMSKSMASLSVTQAQFGAMSAESTYNSDMENAQASLIQGIASIVGGGVAVIGGFAGGFMDALAPAAEDTNGVDSVTQLGAKDETPIADIAPEGETPEVTDSAGKDDASGSIKDEDEVEKLGSEEETTNTGTIDETEEDEIQTERSDIEETEAKQQQEIKKLAEQGNKGGDSSDASAVDGDNPSGAGGSKWDRFNAWRKTYLKDNKTWANIAKFLSSAPQSFSPLATGIGSTMSVQQQEAGAAYKRAAGIDQVTQGLAQSAYQATQSTEGNTDKLVESLIQAAKEFKQMNAAITRG